MNSNTEKILGMAQSIADKTSASQDHVLARRFIEIFQANSEKRLREVIAAVEEFENTAKADFEILCKMYGSATKNSYFYRVLVKKIKSLSHDDYSLEALHCRRIICFILICSYMAMDEFEIASRMITSILKYQIVAELNTLMCASQDTTNAVNDTEPDVAEKFYEIGRLCGEIELIQALVNYGILCSHDYPDQGSEQEYESVDATIS